MAKRPTFIPSIARFKLNTQCATINHMLGDFGCYLVGSALLRPDYRDVDIRFIMADDSYDALFFRNDKYDDLRDKSWSLLCFSLGGWLEASTGLPIDFQIQRWSEAHKYSGGRYPLGVSLDYEGERPIFLKESSRVAETPPAETCPSCHGAGVSKPGDDGSCGECLGAGVIVPDDDAQLDYFSQRAEELRHADSHK